VHNSRSILYNRMLYLAGGLVTIVDGTVVCSVGNVSWHFDRDA
jgi:hypothetical protein